MRALMGARVMQRAIRAGIRPEYGLRWSGSEASGWKKRVVALTVSYLGTRFHGLQYWPHGGPVHCPWVTPMCRAWEPAAYRRAPVRPADEAIENVVEEAAYRAGCISKDNYHSPNKIGLSRACRTDRGVHAVANVLRIKVRAHPCRPPAGAGTQARA